MNPLSARCRLKDRTLPGAGFVLLMMLTLIKASSGFNQHRISDILDLVIHLLLAFGLLYLAISGRSCLWTIIEGTCGIRMARDGVILYEGPAGGIQIVHEDRGVMTLRSSDGVEFQFPRRRAFHQIISQIGAQPQIPGEQAMDVNRPVTPQIQTKSSL